HLGAVLKGTDAHAVALLRRRIPQRHVGAIDRGFLLDDAARHVALRVGLGMALDHVDALDDQTVLEYLHDGPAAAFIAAGGHDDFVTLANLVHCLSSTLQSTSGAREMIFMNCAVRSSRVTGPKMRVPMGSSLLVSSTAALPSKRISDPSGRRTPNLVRTTTASYTSPFLTLPRGMASRMLTLITSPTVA